MNTSSKKRSARIIAILLAMLMVIGCSFAFFTDFANIGKNGTAGTVVVELDDSGINLLNEDGKQILNPGDARDVYFTVSNKGNKSVDIRTVITLTSSVGMSKTEQAEFEVYRLGDVEFVDGEGYQPKDGAKPLQIRSISDDGRTITYQAPIYILNGNEELDDMERVLEPDVATDELPYFDVSEGGSIADVKYVLVYKGSSANAFQAANIDLNVRIDAKQHRNTSPWVISGESNNESPAPNPDQETFNVQYVVTGIDDATKVIPSLSASLTDDASKFYAGVETGCYVDPNTEHADWAGEQYSATVTAVETVSGTPIDFDENGRFITPEEDIIVTIDVSTATNIARVYNTKRQHIGDYPRLDEAFAVAEQTAAEDAAATTSTPLLLGIIPTAFAEPEVNVYVELLTDYTLPDNLVVSSPYTITFTSNKESLNAAGQSEFTLSSSGRGYIIELSAVSTMKMDNIVFDFTTPPEQELTSTLGYISNYGTMFATNTTIKNAELAHSIPLLYNASGATMHLDDFTLTNIKSLTTLQPSHVPTVASSAPLASEGDIYMSGLIDISGNTDADNNPRNLLLFNGKIYLNDDFNPDSSVSITNLGNSPGTIIYTPDTNRLESNYIKAFTFEHDNVTGYGIRDLMYYDGEIYLGVPPSGKYANDARYFVFPAEQYTYKDYVSNGALRECIISEGATGTISFYSAPHLNKMYLNANITLYCSNSTGFSLISNITTKDIDNAIIVGPDVTTFYGFSKKFGAHTIAVDLADSNIKTIAAQAFVNLYNVGPYVNSLTLPSTLESIGDSAFNNNSLTEVIIPASVTSIGASAFNSETLASVVVHSPSVTITSSTFNSAVTTVYATGGEGSISGAGNDLTIVYIDTPETLRVDENGILQEFLTDKYNVATLDLSKVEYLHDNGNLIKITGYSPNLLANNTNTTNVIFPAWYTSDKFDANVIKNAPAVKSVTFKAEGYADTIDTIIDTCGLTSAKFMKSGVEITAYPVAKGVIVNTNGLIVGFTNATGDFTVPATGYAKTANGDYVKITGIAANAFAGSSVTSVTVPVGIYNIDNNAFAGCDTLATVTLEDTRASDEDSIAAILASNVNIQTVNAAIEDYTRLAYVQTTGNNFFNTGIKPNQNHEWEMNFMMIDNGSADQALIGALDSNWGNGFAVWYAYGNKNLAAWFNGSNVYGLSHGGIYGVPTYLHAYDNNLDLKSASFDFAATDPKAAAYSCSGPATIGGVNKGGQLYHGSKVVIYDLKICENDELIADYIPAMNEAGIACLYNRLTGEYKAANNGDFAYGVEIHNTDNTMQSFTR